MVYDLIVAGAGPAGFFAALSAASRGASVLLLERMDSPGRKLLASGSGQCNLTHGGPISDFLDHYGSPAAARFLRPSLYGFSNADLRAFFEERGMPLEETEAGKVFPVSRSARDLLRVLREEARSSGVRLAISSRLVGIGQAIGQGRDFELAVERSGEGAAQGAAQGAATASGLSAAEPLRCRALVIATGGSSYPGTGSTGDGYRLAASLGHGIAEPAPALTPFYVPSAAFEPFADCAGIALRGCAVALFRSGKKVAAGRGDVLFTHRGLSGPGILDLSRHAAPGDEVRLAPVPGFQDAQAADYSLLRELEAHGARSALRVLQGYGLPESLCRALLAAAGADPAAKAAALPKTARRFIAGGLCSSGGFPFPVERLGGWKEAMATRGGVLLSEVDPRTLESRLVPGLHFAGEVLDIDGDTGGYNIQAACSMGRLAGLSACLP